MKPVAQSILHPPHGDCWAACIASILELPLEQVPNAHVASSWDVGWRRVHRFVRAAGLRLVFVERDAETDEWPNDVYETWRPEGYWIALHRVAGGVDHATVWRGDKLVWNPHPDGADDGSDLEQLVGIEWFECLDPALMARNLNGRWRRAERAALRTTPLARVESGHRC